MTRDSNRRATRAPGWRSAVVVFAVALVVRGLTAACIPGIRYLDVIYFDLEGARSFARGELSEGFQHWVPSLYPALLALAYRICDDWELAGRGLGVLCGALTVFPAAAIGRQLGGPRAGLLTAWFMALLPYHVRFSARISSHALYVLCFALALWCALRWLRTGDARCATLFGLAAAAGYWVRQEIVLLVGTTAGVVALMGLLPAARRERWQPTSTPGARTIGSAVVALAVFAAGIAPLVIATHMHTGQWTLSSKGGASVLGAGRDLARLAPDGLRTLWEARIIDASDPQPLATVVRRHLEEKPGEFFLRYAAQWIELVSHAPRVFGYLFLPFALLAFLLLRRCDRFALGDAWGAAVVAVQLAALALFYDSPRLLLSLAPLLVAWSAVGLLAAGERWGARDGRRGPLARGLESPALPVLLVTIMLPFLVHSAGKWSFQTLTRTSAEQDAGRWIREHHGVGRQVMDTTGNVAFYAEARPVLLPVAGLPEIVHYARHRDPPVEFLAFDGELMAKTRPGAFRALQVGAPGLERLGSFIGPRRTVLVYRLTAP